MPSASPSDTTANIIKAKKAIKKAFQYQMEGHGLTIVEVLSTCPTNWGICPRRGHEVARGQHDPVLPAGCHTRIRGGGEMR